MDKNTLRKKLIEREREGEKEGSVEARVNN